MTTETIGVMLAAILGTGGLTTLLNHKLSNRRTKADISVIINEEMSKILKLKEDQITSLTSQVKELLSRNIECEQRDKASQVRMNIMEKKLKESNIDVNDVRQFNVFVLDDDDFVRAAYKKKLSQIPNLRVSTYESIPAIRQEIHRKPEILLLDYKIDNETIDDFVTNTIIKMDGYNPQIVLISGMPTAFFDRLPYLGFIWCRFSKDEDYINKAVNEILDYVNETL